MKRFTLIIVGLAFAISSAHSFAEQGVTDKEVVLGAIFPMSGPASMIGIASELSLRLAAAEANTAGGVNGRQIRMVVEDDGYVPSRAYQGLQKLIDRGVFGMPATGSAGSFGAMLPVIDEQKIPTIVTGSITAAAVEPPRPHIFMIGATYEDLVFALLKYINEHDKPSGPYALLRQDDDYGVSVEAGYKRAVNTFKLPTVEVTKYKRGEKEFTTEALKWQGAKVGALMLGGVITEIPAVLKELSKLKMNIPVATLQTGTIPMVSKMSAQYGLNYYTADYVATIDSDRAKHFSALAKRHLTEEERSKLNHYGIAAYLGARVMIKAIEACGKDVTRTCVAAKIKAMRNFDTNGLAKPFDFSNPKNTAATSVMVMKADPVKGTFTDLTGFVDY